MSQLFAPRRAAEEFDQVLAGDASEDLAGRYAPLLDAVELLRSVPEVMPRPEFSASLRERLMAAAEVELPTTSLRVARSGETTLWALPGDAASPTRRRRRVVGVLSATALLAGGGIGVAAAAEGSLPGDSLYPFKRGVESAVTEAHLSDTGRANAHLDSAGTRLEEVQQMLLRGSDDQAVGATVTDFRTSADEGAQALFVDYQRTGDRTDVAQVHAFAATQMAAVHDLLAAHPDRAGQLAPLADTLVDLDTEARRLCVTCTGETPLAVPQALADGDAGPTLAALVSSPAEASSQLLDTAALKHLLAEAQRVAAEKRAAVALAPQARRAPAPTSKQSGTTATSTPPTHAKASIQGLTTDLGNATRSITQKVTPITGTVTTTIVGGTGAQATKAATTTVDGVTGVVQQGTSALPLP